MSVAPTLSRYNLGSRLGAGGMGEVFEAWDNVLERQVALKLVRDDLAAGSEGRARMLREARMAATLSHPNICVVHDIGEMDGRPFVTMELLRGHTLRSRLREAPRLEVDEALGVARDVASALAAAHDKGIVHRDIKPENIMLLPDGRVKVLDFGLAKPIVDSDGSPTLTASPASPAEAPTAVPQTDTSPLPAGDLTTPGTVLGTYSYLSPEQAEAGEVDARSDVFTFGVVLYEMLTGRTPFQGPSFAKLLEAIKREDPQPLRKVRHDAPETVARITERCLQKEPDRRYPDASELVEDLEHAMPRPRRNMWASWSLVLVAAAALIFAITTMLREKPVAPTIPALKRLTFEGTGGAPYLSPDGTWIAYTTRQEDGMHPAILPTDGGTPRVLQEAGFVYGWGAPGLILLGVPNEENWVDVWELSMLGGSQRLLLESASFPDLHPAGDQLAYSAAPYPRIIRVLSQSTGEERDIGPSGEEAGDCYKPRWSPDGEHLTYECFDSRTGGTHLYLTSLADETGRRRIDPDFLQVGGLYDWTADSRSLVIGARAGGATNIWQLPVFAEGEPRRLTQGTDGDAHPTVNPLNGRLVFLRQEQDSDLVIVDAESGAERQAFGSTVAASAPRFSPDGSTLFAVQERNGEGTVVSLQLDGGRPVTVAARPGKTCEQPLAVGTGIAFVCETSRHEGQAGASDPGTWPREVVLHDPATGRDRIVISRNEETKLLAASIDGESILFVRVERPGLYGLSILELTEGRISDLRDPVATQESIAAIPQPDGRFLVATFDISGPSLTLESIDPTTGDATTLHSLPGWITWASLSEDGRRMAYVTKDEFGAEAWLVDLDGNAEPRQVTQFEGPFHAHAVALSPDGRTLAVERIKQLSDLYEIQNY